MKYNHELAAYLRSPQKNYAIGLSLLKSLNIKVKNIPFFETDSPSRIHHNLLDNYLLNYARVNSIQIHLNTNHLKNHSFIHKYAEPILPEQISSSGLRPKILKNPAVDYDLLPENLKLVYDRNSQLYTELKSFHAKLKVVSDLPDKEIISKVASEIITRTHDIRDGWNQIDTWWNTSLNQDPIENAKKEAIAQDRRIKANLNYVRRNFNKPKFTKELEIRTKELDIWGIAYDKLIK